MKCLKRAAVSPCESGRKRSGVLFSRDALRALRFSRRGPSSRWCLHRLNPVAAGIAEARNERVSFDQTEVEHVEAQGERLRRKPPAMERSGSNAAGLEDSLWLCPIEDRRRLDSSREGMLEGFSLEATSFWSITRGGCFAPGRPDLAELAGILIGWGAVQRAGGLAWRSCETRCLFGRFFAASGEAAGGGRGLNARRVGNLAGCPAP